MWKRRKKTANPRPALPLELCDLCGQVFPQQEAVLCHVPDSSAAAPDRPWSDGLRRLTACGEAHLDLLRERYRKRPYVEEELWAAKIDRVLAHGPSALPLEQLACRTGLHAPEIRRAVAWHNEHLPPLG
ncbi:hypothetical protein ACIRPX_39720 [Streptomyces sp. NPDC101225]|uniref:hypothetical protein n=1 Tax=Streptomyces sp. NPDC101225 TaxID=3366135 RepID=UPI00380FA60B